MMTKVWLKVRIFHRLSPGERLAREGDTILLAYVRPLFQHMAICPTVQARLFRRYSAGGVHIDVRFLGECAALQQHVLPHIEATLPRFLDEYFPPPPTDVEYPPLGQHLYEKFWGTEPLHLPYTYDIEFVELRSLLPAPFDLMQYAFEDTCSMSCLDTLACLSRHQSRFHWALIASYLLLCIVPLPASTIASFCKRMQQRWMHLFDLPPLWEDVFEQRYRHSKDSLTRLLSSSVVDTDLVPLFGQQGVQGLQALCAHATDLMTQIQHIGYHSIRPEIAEIVAHNLLHMLYNRFNISIQEEVFATYLLYRCFHAADTYSV